MKTIIQYAISLGLITVGSIVLLLVAAFTPVVIFLLNYGDDRKPDYMGGLSGGRDLPRGDDLHFIEKAKG